MKEQQESGIQPNIKKTQGLKLIGMKKIVSLTNYDLSELWGSFMPRREEIIHPASDDLISAAVYPPGYFEAFDPHTPFEKWAAREANDFRDIPQGMSALYIPEGLYSVFSYKGSSSDRRIYEYIFAQWLPGSGYSIDHRPHFEVLGENYRQYDPESEEEIWIPIMASQGS